MDDIVMQALHNGWKFGPGTVVRQGPVYHRSPASRLNEFMIWLRPASGSSSRICRRSV